MTDFLCIVESRTFAISLEYGCTGFSATDCDRMLHTAMSFMPVWTAFLYLSIVDYLSAWSGLRQWTVFLLCFVFVFMSAPNYFPLSARSHRSLYKPLWYCFRILLEFYYHELCLDFHVLLVPSYLSSFSKLGCTQQFNTPGELDLLWSIYGCLPCLCSRVNDLLW